MSIAKRLSIAILCIVLIPIHVVSTAAAIKPGSACMKVDQIKKSSGKTFKCTKKGNKQSWTRVPSKPSSTSSAGKPATTTPPSVGAQPKNVAYTPPTQPGSRIDLCKIVDQSIARAEERFGKGRVGSGFPEWKSIIPTKGKIKWALIPIDFPDLPGDADFRTRINGQMKSLSDWYETVSEGQLIIEWVVSDKWVRLPNPSRDYRIEQSNNLDRVPNGMKLWKDAMAESDPVFDFTGVQNVVFVLPKNQDFVIESSQGFPQDEAVENMKTNEGKVWAFSIAGKFFDLPGKEYWAYWAHEFGHAIGIGHVGSSRESNPFQFYDLMGAQDGPSRELTGWLRFYAGWMPEERVHCQELSKLTTNEITLNPLSSKDSGIKLVVIPTSDSKAILIESRRVTKFDCRTPTPRNGVLVYKYDAKLGHGEVFFEAVTPNSRPLERDECGSLNNRTEPSRNLLLVEGEKVNVDGVLVEVLSHGNRDRIRITRGN